ncbi:MAG: recombination-associated protein RdgC [Pseudomonadota bacterium]
MFRNLRAYRLTGDWPETDQQLDRKLGEFAFKPCARSAARSAGWDSPLPREPGAEAGPLVFSLAGCNLLQLRIQTRLLPPAAINEALEDRLTEFARRTGRPPGRAEKKELKDSVAEALLPQALLRSERVRVLYLRKEQLLLVDTPTAATAELVTERLRDALGSLPIMPLEFRQPVGPWLEQVFLGSGPPEFQATRECRLQEPGNTAASVTFADLDLGDPNVQRHVRQGLIIERLGLTFDSVLGLTLDRDGVVRKLKLLDQAAEDLDVEAEASAATRLDADLALWSGLLQKLLRALKRQLGGYARASST